MELGLGQYFVEGDATVFELGELPRLFLRPN